MAQSAGDYRDQGGALKSVPVSLSVDQQHSAAQIANDPLTDAAKPKVKIDTKSRRASETDSTLRFIYYGRFTLDSRMSSPVIAWADNLVEKFCTALLQSESGKTAGGGAAASVDKRLLIVELKRHHIFICFDLFLEKCDAQLRKEAEKIHKRPVYRISQKGNVYFVRRWKAGDRYVVEDYRLLQKREYEGKPPYFVDIENPHGYVGGIRFEPWEVDAILVGLRLVRWYLVNQLVIGFWFGLVGFLVVGYWFCGYWLTNWLMGCWLTYIPWWEQKN
jgi:hypothetical protein